MSKFTVRRTIIAIAISFSILFSSAYFCYYTEAAADFLSSDLNLETFDQEFLPVVCGNGLKIFVPGTFLNGVRSILCFSGFFYDFSFIIPSLGQDTFVLRC